MRILVLGGTRFIGLDLVKRLLSHGHHVTIVSRRDLPPQRRLTSIQCEREAAYVQLKNCAFDQIIDFMAYDGKAAAAAIEMTPATRYIFISTAWIGPYKTGCRQFLPFEIDYVKRKMEAESLLTEAFREGRPVSICRLPVTLGSHDHSERLKFYTRRILQNNCVILPNGGLRETQIAFKDDVVNALTALIELDEKYRPLVFEALPCEDITLFGLVNLMADNLGVALQTHAIAEQELITQFPQFLLAEPLWRDGQYGTDLPNLFCHTAVKPAAYVDWVARLCALSEMADPESAKSWLRPEFLQKEYEFLEGR